ncbi:hypothetical protein OG462_09065 [Streptomyces sp. NBC_01077]|uniref:hypothetical protein n=1 Tax=Streptomyces sp. NBC_01077 TaxID=2903746 RepID=UPI00386F777A|nr:hypothetical protein OG462_09065 [Streptomyces sp. NBC_01077]
MLIVYTPADGGEVERFDHRTVRTSEASIVSRTVDMTWKQVKERLADDDPDAMRGVAWVIKKRSQPTLRYGDFDPMLSELATRLDKKEIEEWAELAVEQLATSDLTPEQAEAALSVIVDQADDADHARDTIRRLVAAPKDPAADEPAAPSDPTEESTPTEPNTSGSSPTSSTSTETPSTT